MGHKRLLGKLKKTISLRLDHWLKAMSPGQIDFLDFEKFGVVHHSHFRLLSSNDDVALMSNLLSLSDVKPLHATWHKIDL